MLNLLPSLHFQVWRCRTSATSFALLEREWPDQVAYEKAAPQPKYLDGLANLVSEALNKPRRSGTRGPARRPDDWGRLPCSTCGHYFAPDAFRKGQSWCKTCENAHGRAYRQTLRGNAVVLCNAARGRAGKRGLSTSLDIEHVLHTLTRQEGCCAYSGVPMEIRSPYSNWRMSLERSNNAEGYVRDNCILVAAEFNSPDMSRLPGVKPEHVHGSAQWSALKIQTVGRAWSLRLDIQQLEADVTGALHDGSSDSLLEGPLLLRRRSKILSSNARTHARRRGLPCEIAYTDVVQRLLEQGGRCFYSGVPLQYKHSHRDWNMSLERLDNRWGYVKDNYVLIAAEFNTTDHSRRARTDVLGSSQWSLAKVMHVWGRAGFLESPPWLNPSARFIAVEPKCCKS